MPEPIEGGGGSETLGDESAGLSSNLGLEAYYPFFKNHKDYSGNSKHFFTTRGFHRSNSLTDYINPNIGSFDVDEKFSIGGWFQSNQDLNPGQNYTLFSNIQATGGIAKGYSFYYYIDGSIPRFSIILSAYDGSLDNGYLNTTWQFKELKAWCLHHYFLTYDGSQTANGFNLYIDGQKYSRYSNFTFPFTTDTISNNFKLMNGARPSPWTNVDSFFGKCNFLRVYRNELLAKHIAQIYNEEKKYFVNTKYAEKVPYPTWSGSISIFLSGHDLSNDSSTLYLRGTEGIEINDSSTLFTKGHIGETDNIPLYLYARDSYAENIPLYVYGTFHHEEGLYLVTVADNKQESGISLYLNAQLDENETYNEMTLYVKSYEVDTIEEGLYLYNQGSVQEDYSENLTLWIFGEYPVVYDYIPLFTSNSQLGIEEGIPIFVQTEGLYEGFYPYGEGMNLYTERWPSATITMYCASTGTPIDNDISLLIRGYAALTDEMTLVIPNVLGSPTDSIKLFTHGI